MTVIAWSAQVEVARKAAEVLAAEHGISAEVLDLRTLVPLDIDAIVATVERTGRAVVVSEAPYSAGFAAEVAATIYEESFYSLEAPVARVSRLGRALPGGDARGRTTCPTPTGWSPPSAGSAARAS